MKDYLLPFTILVDSAETHPWTFQGIKSDAKTKNQVTVVETEWTSLGRHPNSLGDYSIQGDRGVIHVERKSIEDLQGTVLGFPTKDKDGEIHGTARRERFEKELENLALLPLAAVIVEGTDADVLRNIPDYGRKPPEVKRKILFRSLLAYRQDYSVPWFMCESRRMAEITCLRFFERYWKHKLKDERELQKQLKEMADV